MDEPADNTWHQQPWIWFVIGLLVVTMLASFAMLYVAMNNAPDLVVEDYANIEQLTEQTREQDQRAAELGLSAELSIDVAAGNSAVLVLRSSSTQQWPTTITVRTVNSTLASLDTNAVLSGTDGHYTGTLQLPGNAYDLHIEDPERTWRLSARLSGQPSRVTLTPYQPGS